MTNELQRELTAFVQEYDAARNSHDAAAMAHFFAEHADLIGANGRVSTGRDEIRANLAREHASVYRASIARRTVVRVAQLSDDAAIVTGRFVVTGTRSEGDRLIDQPAGLFTLVVKRGGPRGWEIVAYRSMVPADVFGRRLSEADGEPQEKSFNFLSSSCFFRIGLASVRSYARKESRWNKGNRLSWCTVLPRPRSLAHSSPLARTD